MKKIILLSVLILPFMITSLCQAQAPSFVLYGMTVQGGNTQSQDGNIFQFPVGGAGGLFESVYDFGTAVDDGSAPWGSLLLAKNGLLYGMTKEGGSAHLGTIFSFNVLNDSETVLHSFTETGDGLTPFGSLIQASNGLLYGLGTGGGAGNLGAIISFDPTTDSEKVVYSFAGGTYDGEYPYGSLIQAGNGLLYGMTQRGGINDSGVIFSFNIADSTETKLHDFGNDTDASYPSGSLMQASDSLLYGMANSGGSKGYGALFSFNISTGKDSVLHSFADDSTDGAYPFGSLMQAKNGLLYGLTDGGGTKYSGILFSYNISTGALSDIHDFGNTGDGVRPDGTPMQASDGNIYGMTSAGGGYQDGVYLIDGVIFSYDLTDSAYTSYNFTGPNGYLPYYGALVEDDATIHCTPPAAPTDADSASAENISSGNSTTLNVTGTGTFGWYSANTGGAYLGGGSAFTTAVLTDTTTFYVQDSTCAASARTAITVNVSPAMGITAINEGVKVMVYPDPTTGVVYFKGIANGCTVEVYNVLGEIIQSSTATGNNYSINLAGNAQGVYFYRIINNSKSVQQGKMILE